MWRVTLYIAPLTPRQISVMLIPNLEKVHISFLYTFKEKFDSNQPSKFHHCHCQNCQILLSLSDSNPILGLGLKGGGERV